MSSLAVTQSPGRVTPIAPVLFITPRLCQFCSAPIPTARIKARPSATACVPCLQAQGDVEPIRMFTEAASNGDVVESLYQGEANVYQAEHQARRMKFTGCGMPLPLTTEEEVMTKAEIVDEVIHEEAEVIEAVRVTPLREMELPRHVWPTKVGVSKGEAA